MNDEKYFCREFKCISAEELKAEFGQEDCTGLQIMHSREQKQFYEAVLEDPKVKAALQYVEGIDNRLQFLASELMPKLIRIVKADETLARALIGEARIEPTTDPASATPKYLCNLLEKMALDDNYRQRLADL